MPPAARNFDMVDDAMAAILRQKSEAERLAIAFRMWKFAQAMIRANLVAEHADWDEQRVNQMVARRLSHGAG
jgi:hypothetical protein